MVRKKKSWWTYSRCKALIVHLRSKPYWENPYPYMHPNALNFTVREHQRGTWRCLVYHHHTAPNAAWQRMWLGRVMG